MAEEMFADPHFKSHTTTVISFVNTAVGMLQPDLDGAVVALKNLGKKHKRYGILEAHYQVIGEALIGTLSDALGDAFKPEVKDAWVELYGVISSAMIAGAKY